MKKVERTRRARKQCACASPRTSNDAPARPSRPVVSDRMPHAGECCDAPSRRSGGRRGESRCGRARTRAGATEGCKVQEPTGNGCDGHAQYVTPDEPLVEIAHPPHGHARCIEYGNKCANPRCVATTLSAERAPSVSTSMSSAPGASRVPNDISGKRVGQPAEDRVAVHADSAIFIASARLNELRIASTSMPVCFSRLQPTAATSFPFSPSSAINSNVSGVPVNFV